MAALLKQRRAFSGDYLDRATLISMYFSGMLLFKNILFIILTLIYPLIFEPFHEDLLTKLMMPSFQGKVSYIKEPVSALSAKVK